MSIPSRLWRLLRTEFNHRMGRFSRGGQTFRDPFEHQDETKANSGKMSGEQASGQDVKMASYYKALELSYGADLARVKAAYKAQMKKYHPDKFQDAAQKEAATELVKKINEAYAELSKWLEATS